MKKLRVFTVILTAIVIGAAAFALTGCGEEENKKATLESIKITAAPALIDYTAGDLFDPTGMVVKGVNSNGSEQEIVGYSWEPSGALSASDTQVTITYQGKTATQNITVKAAEPDVILENGASKLTLNRGGTAVFGSKSGTWYNSGSKIFLKLDNKDYEFDKGADGKYSVTVDGTVLTSTTISDFFFTEIVFTGEGSINSMKLLDFVITLNEDGTITYPGPMWVEGDAPTGTWKKNGAALEMTKNGKPVDLTYTGGVYSFEFGTPYAGFTCAGIVSYAPPTAFYTLTADTGDYGMVNGETALSELKIANTSDIKVLSKTQLKVGLDTYTANETAKDKRIAAWRIGSATGEKKEIGDTFRLTADTTLVCEWRDARICTITYETGEGTPIAKKENVVEDTKENIAALVSVREGYEIDAWHVGTIDGSVVIGEYNIENDVTLVAEWDRVPQHRFTSDGGYLKLYEDGTAKLKDLESSTGTWTYKEAEDQYEITLKYDTAEGAFNAAGTGTKTLIATRDTDNEKVSKIYKVSTPVFGGYQTLTLTYNIPFTPIKVFSGTVMGTLQASVNLYDTGYYVVDLSMFKYDPSTYTYDEATDTYSFLGLNTEGENAKTTKTDNTYSLVINSMMGDVTVTYTPAV